MLYYGTLSYVISAYDTFVGFALRAAFLTEVSCLTYILSPNAVIPLSAIFKKRDHVTTSNYFYSYRH